MSSNLKERISQCWTKNQSLTALIGFSLLCLIVSLAGLGIDQRLVMGEHAWVKPIKFSVSLAVYGLTLFWLSQYLTDCKSSFQKVCAASLIGTIAELSIIIIQATRGAASHFNTGTPFDNIMAWIAVMAIMPVAFGMVAIFFMLLRQQDLPPVLGNALKWGVFLSILGCIPGIMMLAPAAVQNFIIYSKHLTANTAGLPQPGPGLPFLGWSTVAGDLRVAHFVGIHALQFFPIVAFLIMKSVPNLSKFRQELLVNNVGVTYALAIALLTRQALLAEPLTSPSHHTLAYAVLVALVSLNIAVYTMFAPHTVAARLQEAER